MTADEWVDGERINRVDRLAARTAPLLARMERFYLAALRVVLLLAATALLVWAAVLLLTWAVQSSRSAEGVRIEPVALIATDIVPPAADAGAKDTSLDGQAPDANRSPPAEAQAFYSSFARDYFQLYRSKFAPFARKGEPALTKAAFDKRFVGQGDRLKAIADGSVDFKADQTMLVELGRTLRQAADLPDVRRRLGAAQTARKTAKSRRVERTRTRYEERFNAYSTNCDNYYIEPFGCTERVPVTQRYNATETAQSYPDGTESQEMLFAALHDRFFRLRDERLAEARGFTEAKRAEILAKQAEATAGLGKVLKLAGAFLVLMFVFLLVAMERHQRGLRRDNDS